MVIMETIGILFFIFLAGYFLVSLDVCDVFPLPAYS